MEDTIFKYIEYLLPTSNCVILPEFGAFIISLEHSYKLNLKESNIFPADYNIRFNSEIKSNDGFLASQIAEYENISYKNALSKLNREISELKKELSVRKQITCGNLGNLTLNQNNLILFHQNKEIKHPELYGLGRIRLQTIDNLLIGSEQRKIRKYSFTHIAAASVATLLMLIPSIQVNQSSSINQTAGFSYSLTANRTAPDTTSVSSDTNKVSDSNVISDIENKQTPIASSSEDKDIAVPIRMYYVIVGGEQTIDKAKHLLDKIKGSDFRDANIVASKDRYRVYSAAFTDKTKAQAYLEKLRNEKPKYQTAWLFSRTETE